MDGSRGLSAVTPPADFFWLRAPNIHQAVERNCFGGGGNCLDGRGNCLEDGDNCSGGGDTGASPAEEGELGGEKYHRQMDQSPVNYSFAETAVSTTI